MRRLADTVTVTAQGLTARLNTTSKGVGTTNWPKPGTTNRPPTGTFPWPRTACSGSVVSSAVRVSIGGLPMVDGQAGIGRTSRWRESERGRREGAAAPRALGLGPVWRCPQPPLRDVSGFVGSSIPSTRLRMDWARGAPFSPIQCRASPDRRNIRLRGSLSSSGPAVDHFARAS